MGQTGRLRAISGLFLASGAAAVLATYLAGVALGGWLLGGRADRAPRPLRFYGLLELGIGATALIGTLVLRVLEPLHEAAALRLAPGSPALLLIRVLLASLVVLPPTFLMGATLPAMTRVFVDRIGSVGRELGLLYALNTAGAVGGSLLAGFVLVRAAGVHPTLWLAAAANFAVGAIALALTARSPAAVPEIEQPAARVSGG